MIRGYKSFWRQEEGAISVMLVGVLVVVVLAMMLGLDAARMYLLRSRLEAALYAAALAGGATAEFMLMVKTVEEWEAGGVQDVKLMNEEDVIYSANRFFHANFPRDYMGADVDGPHIGQGDGGRSLKIVAHVRWPTLLGRLQGEEHVEMQAEYPIIRYGADVPNLSEHLRLR